LDQGDSIYQHRTGERKPVFSKPESNDPAVGPRVADGMVAVDGAWAEPDTKARQNGNGCVLGCS